VALALRLRALDDLLYVVFQEKKTVAPKLGVTVNMFYFYLL